MNWENFQLWYNYLLNTQYKDNNIDIAISEFGRVIADHKNEFKSFEDEKSELKKEIWNIYGKINNILNKIKIKYKVNIELPRNRCEKIQKHQRKNDVKVGKMYNMSAEVNGIDTNDNTYFYIPIHKTRRHIHGVPKDFLILYVMNMIDTAEWDKVHSWYYYDNTKLNVCAIYKCPEKYCIENIQKRETIKKENIQNIKKEISCTAMINIYSKINELSIYFTDDQNKKIKNYFFKKLADNFRKNFPKKSRQITYCVGECLHTSGKIHNGIPNGKQKCYECKITYCRECGKTPYHIGELCNFSNEITFENPDEYRKCPGCGIWIEREEGCAHMKCPCGVHFCYQCRDVLCASDPYYHICRMDNPDPHFRDFPMNHASTQYTGEVACNCRSCR